MTEYHFQCMAAKYLDYHGFLWYHCPNEASGTSTYFLKRARSGVKRGVPDVMIFNSSDVYRGLAIELKVGRNVPTQYQVDFLSRLSDVGWCAVWVDDFNGFISLIRDYSFHREVRTMTMRRRPYYYVVSEN